MFLDWNVIEFILKTKDKILLELVIQLLITIR